MTLVLLGSLRGPRPRPEGVHTSGPLPIHARQGRRRARASAARPLLVGLLAAPLLLAALAPPCGAQTEDRWAKHYRERVERFRAENAALPADARPVVFVGDSITEGFPLARHLAGVHALNRGISSDRIGQDRDRGVLHRLDDSVFAARPRAVFLLIGVNDLASSSKPPEHWLTGLEAIVAAIRAREPRLPIVLHTLLPTGSAYRRQAELNPKIAAFNDGVRALARTKRLPLIDLHARYRGEDGLLPAEMTGDGLHLKGDAYARWAEAAKAVLASLR